MSETPAFLRWRTSLFQRFADVYPTHRVGSSPLARAGWRVALEAMRPGHVVMRLPDYRIRLELRPKYHGRTILHRGGIEPAMTAAFRECLRPGMVVADVGANVGHYSLIAAGRVGDQGHVYAFEPEPTCARLLRANLEINGSSNFTIVPQAVSRADGRAPFYRDRANPGGHAFAEAVVRDPADVREVGTVTLDTFFRGRIVDVLKLDTQGAEAWILEGAREVLGRSRAHLFVEFWPFGLKQLGSDPGRLLGGLRELGYAPAKLFQGRKTLDAEPDGFLAGLAAEADNRHAAADVCFTRT